MYFEYNFPKATPTYFYPDLAAAYNKMAPRVAARMDRMEEALTICSSAMTPAQFSKAAKTVFDHKSIEAFDAMSAEDIANGAKMFFEGEHVEPRVEFPDAITVVDAAFITVKEWELFRHLGIGGSDAAVIQGLSPYTTRRMLYSDKVGIPKRDDGDSGAQFVRGHVLEPVVIQTFADLHPGCTVIEETRMFTSMFFPGALADVDALVRMPDGKLYVFEAKSTVKDNIFNWRLGGNSVPRHYVTQCHQYPAVLCSDEIQGTIIACLFVEDTKVAGKYATSAYDVQDFLWREIPRDAKEEEKILTADTDFFVKHVMGHVMPEMDTSLCAKNSSGNTTTELADAKLIRLQMGDPDPDAPPVIIDEDDFRDLADTYLTLNQQKSDLNREVAVLDRKMKDIKARFIDKMGNAAFATIPDEDDDDRYLEVKNSLSSRVSIDSKKLADKFPEAYDECARRETILFGITVKSKAEEAKKAAKKKKKASK